MERFERRREKEKEKAEKEKEKEKERDGRPRRPSSVLEHVGNVLERFGKRVGHSRGESRGSESHSKRASSSLSLKSTSAADLHERMGSGNTDGVVSRMLDC